MVRTYGRLYTTLFAFIHLLRNDWRVHANAAVPNKFNTPGRVMVCVYACVLLGVCQRCPTLPELSICADMAGLSVLVLVGGLYDFLLNDDSVTRYLFFW